MHVLNPVAQPARDDAETRIWRTCPVCDATAARPYVSFRVLDFVRCGGCGAVFKSREAGALREASFYEHDYFVGRRSGREKRFEHRVNKAKRHIIACLQFARTARSLLDIGCSLGYVIEAGRRLQLGSAGTDISHYAVEQCRHLGHDARVGSLEALPFDDASFDIVVMKHVLEHTPEPRRALAEVRRVLREGGVTLVIVPHLRYWKGLWLRRRGRYFRPDDLGRQHYVYYSLPALRRLLHDAGFDVVADSKALFRGEELGRRGTVRRLWQVVREVARFAALWVWQAAARALLQQRELFVIAKRSRAPDRVPE